MGKKGNSVGNETGYRKIGEGKNRARKKDQNIFQLGPNVGLWTCAKKVTQLHPVSRKYALSVTISSCVIFMPIGQKLQQ